MRLFVDDIREPWEGWHLARTISQAIRLLSTGHVKEISLDHDIQQTVFGSLELETFEPVARYVALMSETEQAAPYVQFHTSNPAGGQRMANIIGVDYLERRVDYAKFGKETI